LVVPLDAVVRTGTRDVVYVETDSGVFAPRAITLGPQRGGRYEVAAGLAAGERVAAKGVYFLDSEATIRTAAEGGRAPGHAH
jgi:Cu(I)/Ag(I) efflux system membrane fusion protein